MFVFLIQSQLNGYVYCVFNNLNSAQQWMKDYKSRTCDDRHPYEIIARELWDNLNSANKG